jgi:hypothetical protein
MSSLSGMKIPSLDDFKMKMSDLASVPVSSQPQITSPKLDENKIEAPEVFDSEHHHLHQLVIGYSKQIPDEVKNLFASLGKVVEFSNQQHGNLNLLSIDFNYLYIDITKQENRVYLKLHREELDTLDTLGFAHKWEIEILEKDRPTDSWTRAFNKTISHFDVLIGDIDKMRDGIFNDKLKYISFFNTIFKKCLACVGGQ